MTRFCFRSCCSRKAFAAGVTFTLLAIVVALGAKEPKDRFSTASPSPEQLEAAETELKVLFQERLARANSPAQCSEVAEFLLEQNSSFSDRPDLQFALFGLASGLAEKSEDLQLIETAFAQWSERFDLDAGDRQARILYRLARRWPEERSPELVTASVALVERELAQPSDSTLESVDGLLQYLAAHTQLADASATIRQLRTKLSAERRYRGDLELAKQTLVRSPEDPQAHTIVGLHLCLRDELWTLGLSHLAKSNEASIREAARVDREQPSTGEERMTLADRWLEIARQNELRKGFAIRAAHWYSLARPQVEPRRQLQIDDRMTSISAMIDLPVADLLVSVDADEPTESPAVAIDPLANEPVAMPQGNANNAAEQEAGEELSPTRSWDAHGATIWCMALSPDRTRLATAGEDRVIKIWKLATGELEAELVGSENTIFALSFMPEENALLSGGMDDQVRKWSLDDPGQSQVIGRHESCVRSVFLDSRGLIVSGSDDRHIALWHPTRGLVDRRQAHESIVYETALSPDGKWLVTAGQDRLVKLWNPNRPQPILLSEHRDKVRALSFTPDGKSLITAGEDQRVLMWSLPPAGPPRELRTSDFIYDTDISPDGKWLAAVGREKRVQLWSIEDFSPGPVLSAVRDELKAVAFASATQIVAVGKDGKVYVWDLE